MPPSPAATLDLETCFGTGRHWNLWQRELAFEREIEHRTELAWYLAFRVSAREYPSHIHEADVAARDIYADGTPKDDGSAWPPNAGVLTPCYVGSYRPGHGLTPRQRVGSAKTRS